MTVYNEVMQYNSIPWVGQRPQLISKKLVRRILRVLWILFLALIFFLLAAQPVVAVFFSMG